MTNSKWPWAIKTKLIVLLVFLTVGVLVDQIVKVWARQALAEQSKELFGGVLKLILAENSGAFLSLGASLNPELRRLLFVVIVAAFLIWALVWLVRSQLVSQMHYWGWCFVIAGGVGNLIDRIAKSSVTDYLFLDFGFVTTGVFNIADMFIVVGFILLVWPDRSAKASSSTEPAKL